LENINNETKRSYNSLCDTILTSEHNITVLQNKNNDFSNKLNEIMDKVNNFKSCSCSFVKKEQVNDLTVVNETVNDLTVVNETVNDLTVVNETVNDLTVVNETVNDLTV
jgi:hypothetical protein